MCWRIELDQSEDRVAVLAEVLSPDERERADRFVVLRDRRRFIVTRACLRALLARACEVPAAAIRFAYAPLGKAVAAEANTIAAVPADERDLAFFLCWTRKEASSKARGDGLSLALDRSRETCRPGEPARILEIDGNAAEAAEWSVHDLRPAPGVVGAAVMRAAPRPRSLNRFDVDHEVEA